MKTICIIQARLTSKRFPKKIMEILNGKTVLQNVIDAVNKTSIRHVIVASPHFIEFDYADRFVGDENDVLSRYYWCAKKWAGDIVVRITSDCPLMTPEIIGMALEYFNTHDYPYIILSPISGLDVEVFTFKLLEKAFNEATEPYDREHVTPFMKRYTKLSLDTPEDLERIKNWISGQGPRK